MKTARLQSGILLGLIIVLSLVWWRHQQLQDWWRLRGYTPPNNIVQLANEDTMNAYTRHLFYLNRPQLPATVTQFRAHCPENEDTIVLGCYHPDQNGIFIFAVQGPTLGGIQQVTAAHEVLHAVYARLNGPDRQKLDQELESYYEHGLVDPSVKAEVALYKKTEPTAVYDEMSCTFGTELASLPPSLESYYAHYFTNRQKIVDFEAKYGTEFTSREQQITGYDSRLSNMKSQINSIENSLINESTSLGTQKAQLQRLLATKQVQAYGMGMVSYNRQIEIYNANVTDLTQDVATYNQLVSTRNSVAGQLATLDNAIDTRMPMTVTP